MQRDAAVALALQALGWLAADDELIGAFLGLSGLDLASLRARAADPDLLGSVLDFVLAEDMRVLAFAQAVAIKPEQLLIARQALPGGEVPFWT